MIGIGFLLGLPWLVDYGKVIPWPANNPMTEICDNAIDDDGDGLIDLNDPDCDCPVDNFVSLVPNPSFEELLCCPDDRGKLNCADGWNQASEATTDLIIPGCEWSGYPEFPPPLPLPDGEAILGIRNGVPFVPGQNSRAQPNWKEYGGACLNAPMLAGETYIFSFYVGFTAANSPPMELAFYGAPDCGFLPFGRGNAETGCPTNVLGWSKINSVEIAGTNEWQLIEIELTPQENSAVIVFGPGCDLYLGDVETLYFFDRIYLAPREGFDSTIRPRGNPCNDDYFLEAPEKDTLSYQWYRNGIALPGETTSVYFPDGRAGSYQVRLIGPNSCSLLESLRYERPIIRDTFRVELCAEDTYFFGGQQLSQPGTYRDSAVSKSGCDSLPVLFLERRPLPTDSIAVKILPGEVYVNSGRSFADEGRFTLRLDTPEGCDSLLVLDLSFYRVYIPNAFSPNGDGMNDRFTLFTGPGVEEVTDFQVFDRWGGLLFSARQDYGETGSAFPSWDGHGRRPAGPTGVFVYRITILFDDGRQRTFTGDVAMIR